MWKLVKRFKIKMKTARPTHVLKDEQASERFKKNFPELVNRKTVWFQDEMRFGLRTQLMILLHLSGQVTYPRSCT